MKKLIIPALLCVTALSCAFAFTDSFEKNRGNKEYYALIDALKDQKDEGAVSSLYDSYISTEKDPLDKARIEYHMVRFYKDRKMKDEAKIHFERFKEGLGASNETGYRREIAEIELRSSEYYLTGSLSAGMETSSRTKELYKNHPDEITAILLEANRLVYSPMIGGGSPKKGQKLFETLKSEEKNLQKLYLFDMYSGIGVALEKRNRHDDAIEYLKKASAIYSGDPTIKEILEKPAEEDED